MRALANSLLPIARSTDWLRRTFELQDPAHARLLPMEGLRGMAVSLVFLQHYCVQAELIGLPQGVTATFAALFHSYGNFGVELFFVFSGYLIYGALVRRQPPFVMFMRRRIVRIYPAFLAVFCPVLLATFVFIPGRIPNGAIPARRLHRGQFVSGGRARADGPHCRCRLVIELRDVLLSNHRIPYSGPPRRASAASGAVGLAGSFVGCISDRQPDAGMGTRAHDSVLCRHGTCRGPR